LRAGIGQDDVDPSSHRLSNANLRPRAPSPVEAANQSLDDPCLMSIPDGWTGVREQPHRKVGAKSDAQSFAGLESRADAAGFDPRNLGLIDARYPRECAL
jgi:hypothetical protein